MELGYTGYDFTLTGNAHRLREYAVGGVIDRIDGATVEEATDARESWLPPKACNCMPILE